MLQAAARRQLAHRKGPLRFGLVSKARCVGLGWFQGPLRAHACRPPAGAVPCPHLHQRAPVRSSSPTALAGPAGWHRAAAPAVLHATAGDEPTGPRLVPLRHCGPPSWWGAILGVGAGRCGPPRIGSQPVRHLGLP